MKKGLLYSGLFITALALNSCNSFLEEEPKDQITETTAYQSSTLIYLNTVASLYSEMGNIQGNDRQVYDLNTFSTDDAVLPTRGGDWYDGGLWQNLFKHNWSVDNSIIKNAWDTYYRVIAKCNQSIDKLKELKEADPSNTAIDPYLAEVRALRAIYYFYALDMFGQIPIVESSSQKIADVAQSTRSEVFAFTLKELQEAVPLLSPNKSNQSGEYYGRVTQGVAYFYLMKLCLNANIYTDNNTNDGTHPDAMQIAINVDGTSLNPYEATIVYGQHIALLNYSLESNFSKNFAVENESSSENIFTVAMDPVKFPDNQFLNVVRSRHYEHAKAFGQGGWNGASATIEALNAFGYGTASQDPRFDMTYFAGQPLGPDGNPIVMADGETLEYHPSAIKLDLSGDTYEKTAGARMKKYAFDTTAQNDGMKPHNDAVIARYSDVLLMISEAKVRDGQDGTTELNEVRGRVGASTNLPATLENLYAERMRELAWEGWRRNDMVRFGTFTDARNDRPQLTGEANGFTEVFCIPQAVLDLNSKLTQNPGY